MSEIRNISGMSPDEITFELKRGGRFVIFRYCCSLLLVTFILSTDVYFVRAGQSRVIKALPWILLSLVAGWWGIPWGPIRTIQSLWINFRGGTDVTAEIAAGLRLTGVSRQVVGEG